MTALTCREFIEFLDEYITNSIPAERLAAFERHLQLCPYCQDYLKTYRETIRLTRESLSGEAPNGPPPADAPEELIQAILKSRRR